MASLSQILELVLSAERAGAGGPEIGEILNKDNIIAFVADDQTPIIRHPLGFFQVRLGEISGQAVRLHLWSDQNSAAPPVPVDIHSHPWPMHSFILAGGVANTLYEVIPSCSGAGELYEVSRRSGRVFHSKLNERVDWRGNSTTYCVGQDYKVEAAEFHSSLPGVGGAVTLMIAGNRSGDLGRVVKSCGSISNSRTRAGLPFS